MAFGQANDRLLHVAAGVGLALPALGLALGDQRVDAQYLDIEQRLDVGLDGGLGCVVSDLAHHRVIFAAPQRILGSHRNAYHLMLTTYTGFCLHWYSPSQHDRTTPGHGTRGAD